VTVVFVDRDFVCAVHCSAYCRRRRAIVVRFALFSWPPNRPRGAGRLGFNPEAPNFITGVDMGIFNNKRRHGTTTELIEAELSNCARGDARLKPNAGLFF